MHEQNFYFITIFHWLGATDYVWAVDFYIWILIQFWCNSAKTPKYKPWPLISRKLCAETNGLESIKFLKKITSSVEWFMIPNKRPDNQLLQKTPNFSLFLKFFRSPAFPCFSKVNLLFFRRKSMATLGIGNVFIYFHYNIVLLKIFDAIFDKFLWKI